LPATLLLLAVLFSSTPLPVFPEMTFRWVTLVPPTRFVLPVMLTPVSFAAAAPSGVTPM
jgi:hypothetical protein